MRRHHVGAGRPGARQGARRHRHTAGGEGAPNIPETRQRLDTEAGHFRVGGAVWDEEKSEDSGQQEHRPGHHAGGDHQAGRHQDDQRRGNANIQGG